MEELQIKIMNGRFGGVDRQKARINNEKVLIEFVAVLYGGGVCMFPLGLQQ